MARSGLRSLVIAALAAVLLLQVFSSMAGFVLGGGPTTPSALAGSARRDAPESRVISRSSRFDPPSELSAPFFAEKTASGLASKVLKAGDGSGKKPGPAANVKVHYTGWKSSSGVMFDSSYLRNNPSDFKLQEVIPGWKEGIQLMEVGETRRFWIPGELAYGKEEIDLGVSGAAPKGELCFDVTLISIEDPGENIIFFFAGAFGVLILGTIIVSLLTTEPERPEYENPQPFGYKPYLNNQGKAPGSL